MRGLSVAPSCAALGLDCTTAVGCYAVALMAWLQKRCSNKVVAGQRCVGRLLAPCWQQRSRVRVAISAKGLTRGFSHSGGRVAEAPLAVPRQACDAWLGVSTSTHLQAGHLCCPSWQPWTVRRCCARPPNFCMRGTCAPSASRRRLPNRMPSPYIVRPDGGCCMGALGARHRRRWRHFFVGSGRRGDGLRGARGV